MQFSNEQINLSALRRKAYNFRWAEVPEGVLPLTAADPDFPVAPEVISALQDYLADGYLPYTPKLGLPEFRNAVAKAFRARKQEPIEPELVLPMDSAARGMYLIAQTFLKPGDEAIVFDPVDFLFQNAVRSAGAKPVYYPARVLDGRVDLGALEQYVTPATRMICLCNPHNPLGRVYTREQLDYLLRFAEAHDLWIMNDEIWSDIVFDDAQFCSILSLGAERNRKTISVYGFSKGFGVAGLRIGCVYCTDEEAFARLTEASGVLTTAGGLSSLSQVAGVACLEKAAYWTQDLVRYLQRSRDWAAKEICAIPGLSTLAPEATYLFWIDMHELPVSNTELTDFLQQKVQLALVPGSEQMFGPGAAGYVRLCFSTSFELLQEGVQRLKRGIELLGR